MSVPVGPQGSLLVAEGTCQLHAYHVVREPQMRTISDFDLHRRVTLGHILDCSYDFRHASWSEWIRQFSWEVAFYWSLLTLLNGLLCRFLQLVEIVQQRSKSRANERCVDEDNWN